MRNFVSWVLALMIIWGCGSNKTGQKEKPVVLVSILPQKTFVEKIGGDDFNVVVLIPHGANPVTYSLLPAQMEAVSSASIWFRMGYVGFELSWGDRIREANPRMKTIDLSSELVLLSGNLPATPGQKSGIDPHTWMSPGNVRIMAGQILEELKKIHPGKAGLYDEQYRAFLEEIGQTDIRVREIVKESKGKKLITYHPSLTYFCRDFGLTQLSVEEGGKEPTPGRMAFLSETATTEGIRVIYIQSEFDRELAQVFANETGGKVIQIWPLNPDWSTNLLEIARLIREN